MDALNFAMALPATLPRLTANQAQALSLIATHGADVAVTLPPLDGVDAEPGAWRVSHAPRRQRYPEPCAAAVRRGPQGVKGKRP